VGDDELEAYVATGEPLEVAGGFKIDARGGAFIERVDGDPHAVVGLSVSTVRSLASEFGVGWPAFWNRG
jgi:septum formation protein